MKAKTFKNCKCGGVAERVKIYSSKRYDCFIRCRECGHETQVYVSTQGAERDWNRWREKDETEND